MNGRRVTDDQVSRALRAHLPERAAAGLRERVLATAESTAQQRALPSFLGALNEADPVSRRRSLLIAAALLVALAFASAAAVGALRLLQRDPVDELSLEPPADVPAFVLSSRDQMRELPPVAMTWLDDGSADNGSTKSRIYVHRSGAVRFDRYASADATEPTTYTILSGNRVSGMAIVGPDKVWVGPGDEAIEDDPRVFVLGEIQFFSLSLGGPGCEVERNPDEVGNGTAASGWRYVGVEYVAGRPAHHVACGGDLWLDIETRVMLRARAPLSDDAGQPIPGAFRTIEVTEIAFGEQPAALFEPPEGIKHMPDEAYGAYLCTRESVPLYERVGLAGVGAECPPTPGAQPGGTYVLDDPFPLRLSMSAGDGWTVVEGGRFYHAGGVTKDDGRTGLRFVMVDTLTKDACAERAGATDGHATVDDLVAFLTGLPLIDIAENTDVTLDGYRGKYLEFTRTAGEIDCGWGGLDGWPASSPSAIDEDDRVWILDVGGVPLVIDAFSTSASETVRAELRQIVESIQIEPTSTRLPTSTPLPTVRPRPSGPAGPLAWSEAILKEDWPAPVRPEPAGGSSVLPMPLTHMDPTGDTGSDIDPWVDIRAVMGDTSSVDLKLVSNQPPVVDPTEQWIAYGVVTDDDRDGVPDWRYGIDNMPVDATGEQPHRVWRTNLHTGRTDDQGFLPEGYGRVWPYGADANFEFGGTADVAGQGMVEWGIELDMPFYTWASVIVNGRVVATDYAPDAGWLIASPGAQPGGTYLLEDPFPLRLSMSVADGWTVFSDRNAGGVTRDSRKTGLLIVIIDNPFKDACNGTIDPPLGPSVDDLVTFLAGLPLIDISENTDVKLDGYRGKYLEYTKTAGETEWTCGVGGWPTNSQGKTDEYNEVWILDVDGVRLVINAFSSETDMTELRQIVDSIQIEP